MTLAQAILLIPPGVHLRCGRELNETTGSVFGSACLFVETRPIVSITTDETDFVSFELLLVNMIVRRYGTDLQIIEARTALDQQALCRDQEASPKIRET